MGTPKAPALLFLAPAGSRNPRLGPRARQCCSVVSPLTVASLSLERRRPHSGESAYTLAHPLRPPDEHLNAPLSGPLGGLKWCEEGQVPMLRDTLTDL
jgi:hypothetical protein